MLKMPEGEAIEHSMVTRSIESAQRKVEARNFDIRKQLLEYDDVANDQRKTIYALRNELLESEDVSPRIADLRAGVVDRPVPPVRARGKRRGAVGHRRPGERAARPSCGSSCRSRPGSRRNPSCTTRRCSSASSTTADEAYAREDPGACAEASFRQYERYVMLQILDAHWREHLAALDHLRQGIHLRGYAQKNPKQEYKREAFELFGAMLEAVKLEVIKTLITVEIRAAEEVPQVDDKPHVENVRLQHADYEEALAAGADDGGKAKPAAQPVVRAGAEGRPQRSLPLRLGQEVQALPREADEHRMAVNLPPPDPKLAAPRARRRAGRRDGGHARSRTARTCW